MQDRTHSLLSLSSPTLEALVVKESIYDTPFFPFLLKQCARHVRNAHTSLGIWILEYHVSPPHAARSETFFSVPTHSCANTRDCRFLYYWMWIIIINFTEKQCWGYPISSILRWASRLLQAVVVCFLSLSKSFLSPDCHTHPGKMLKPNSLHAFHLGRFWYV